MKIRSSVRQVALLFGTLVALPSLASAHTGVSDASGFGHGFLHPIFGIDHVCAMVAVGLWAAQMGGRALWAVPLSFVSVMLLGAELGMAGNEMPFVEQGIVLSVLLLGVLIAAAAKLPLWASMGLVGVFALFHGNAHGLEMPENASGLLYGAGFVLATALLHTVGIGIGVGIQKVAKPVLVRVSGAAVALCGVYLWVS